MPALHKRLNLRIGALVPQSRWRTVCDHGFGLRIEKNAGHTGGDMVKKSVEKIADEYAFAFDQIRLPPAPKTQPAR